MASFASELIAAVRAALRADAAVQALVKQAVYDVVPGVGGTPNASIVPPWIYIGPLSAPRFEDSAFRAWQPRIRLFCASDAFTRDQAWAMVDAIDIALDGKTLVLAEPFAMTSPLQAIEAGDVIDPTKPRVAFCDFQCVIYRDEPFAPDPS